MAALTSIPTMWAPAQAREVQPASHATPGVEHLHTIPANWVRTLEIPMENVSVLVH